MSFDIANVDRDFPFKEFRDGQKEAIEFIISAINNGKKYIFLEAPTGSGKSPIGLTLAKMANQSFYVTTTKILQDQLVKDFGRSELIELKGRNAYECTYRKANAEKLRASKVISEKRYIEWKVGRYTCESGYCRSKGVSTLKECACPYQTQLQMASASKTCLMNFSAFLCHLNFTHHFGHPNTSGPSRELIVIDECHNIESQILDFVSLTISEAVLDGQSIPVFESASEYAKWIVLNDIEGMIASEIIKAIKSEDIKKADDLTQLKNKIATFVAEQNHDKNWVAEFSDGRMFKSVCLKPVYVSKYAHEYLFRHTDIVVMMSATILDVNVMSRALGIPKEMIAAKRMKSRFPVANRPIYFKPAAKMTGGKSNMHKWSGQLVKGVDAIIAKYQNVRGIIHTHNFAIAELLMEESSHKERFVFQKNYPDKFEMLKAHARKEGSIIVAPAMHEGIDLKDDLSRFQIVCKVPFPNFYENKQLAARKEADPAFYDWLVALKTCQCTGRSIRSKDDWAHTYIIDESFRWWYQRNKNMLPKWFIEAVVNLD